jgi:acyl-CoA thioester hydrolase
MSNTRALEISVSLEPKTYDIDFSGIVSNIVYIRWLEDLRLIWLQTHFRPLNALLEDGICPVILQTRVDYKRALLISDKPSGRMWVTGYTRFKWILSAEISARGRTRAIAEQTGGFLNLDTKQAVPVPDDLYSKFSKAVDSA